MRKKIFIVEDDANILYALQAKFSLAGFQVEVNCGNIGVEELVNNIKEIKPDFMILDLILPKADGFDLLKAIRKEESLYNLLLFIFTNLSDQDTKGRGLTLGANYYFVKHDFSIDDFVAKVVKIVKNRKKSG